MPNPTSIVMEDEWAETSPSTMIEAKVDDEVGFSLTRPEFIDVIERVLSVMGAHFEEYERERLREFAQRVSKVTFGSWSLKPGCPLQQTGMCTSSARQDSVHELFIEHFDFTMRKLWGLGTYDQGVVTIL